MMISDEQPPQPDQLALEFAKAVKRMPYKPVVMALPADIYQELRDYSAQQQVPESMVVAKAIATYVEMKLMASQQTPKVAQVQWQNLRQVYEAARFQIWMVRRKIEEWKGDRFCAAFFQVKELKKQLEEGDRNV